jgi:maltoporin
LISTIIFMPLAEYISCRSPKFEEQLLAMKRGSMILFLFAAFLANSTQAAELEAHGYLRAGTGTNGKGAKQECIYNRGSPANEFRLGNECSIYGESAFRINFSNKDSDQPSFSSQVRFAYFPSGNSSFEDNDTDGRDLNIVEAFAEANRIENTQISLWAGKRFYRDVDLHIFDWYYYGQMNGNGGGIGNIPLLTGKFAAAWLMETGSTRTNVGKNAVQVFDIRWSDLQLSETSELNFWLAHGLAPGSSAINSNLHYKARSGWIFGSRWRKKIATGFWDLTLVNGRGLLEGINLYGNPLIEQNDDRTDAYRWRLVQDLALQPSDKIALHFSAATEFWNPQKPNIDSRGTWWAIGARPIYFFSKNLQLAFEAGHSQIHIRDERSSGGLGISPRKLSRFTLAPQYSIGSSLFARPVLRVFYSYSSWNESNRAYVAVDAPSFAGTSHGQALGVQTEVWF